MSEHGTIDESLEGEQVFNAEGNEIGMVSAVRGETVYVDPDPGITDRISSMLGWDDIEEEDYPLPENAIERVDEDGIHLRRNF